MQAPEMVVQTLLEGGQVIPVFYSIPHPVFTFNSMSIYVARRGLQIGVYEAVVSVEWARLEDLTHADTSSAPTCTY